MILERRIEDAWAVLCGLPRLEEADDDTFTATFRLPGRSVAARLEPAGKHTRLRADHPDLEAMLAARLAPGRLVAASALRPR